MDSGSEELKLLRISSTHDHTLPILDSFQDDGDASVTLIVTPFLRPINYPAFIYVEELMDFGEQILEVS